MTNLTLMRKCLHEKVISALLSDGFTGKYPHYRKNHGDWIELVSFQTNKYGGSFTVEVSAVFPNRVNTNCAIKTIVPETVTVWDTNRRYRLKGMYDGWFHYQDVYVKPIFLWGKSYYAVTEKEEQAFLLKKGYRLVQSFCEETAMKICDEINLQMVTAFRWTRKLSNRK